MKIAILSASALLTLGFAPATMAEPGTKADADAKVTLKADAMPTPKAEEAWRQFDKDGNNELSLAEFTQLRVAQYAAIDRNGDGRWTRKEFVKREDGMRPGRIDSLRKKFKRWDEDGDGLWNTAEAAQAIEGNFKWLDKNKNGSLAIKEFPKQF